MISKVRRLEVTRAAEEAVNDATSLPINPIEIAQSRDITVESWEPKDLGVSGFLMKQGDVFGIGYSTRLKNRGFENFTVGHELGHYFIPGHPAKLFPDGSGRHLSKSGFISDDPCEREADLFAARLLMPDRLFREELSRSGEGFAAIERLAGRCQTSLTSTAIRFAECSEDPVAVIVSSDDAVEFCFLSPPLQELPAITWPKRGTPIPRGTATSMFQSDPRKIQDACQEKSCSMLDDWLDGAPRIEVKEDVVGLGQYGKVLTVLFTDEPIEPEDPDESEDSFDHMTRWG